MFPERRVSNTVSSTSRAEVVHDRQRDLRQAEALARDASELEDARSEAEAAARGVLLEEVRRSQALQVPIRRAARHAEPLGDVAGRQDRAWPRRTGRARRWHDRRSCCARVVDAPVSLGHLSHPMGRAALGPRQCSRYSGRLTHFPGVVTVARTRGGSMEFGVQFFPAVGPETKPASQYFAEALRLTEQCRGAGLHERPHGRTLLPPLRRLLAEPAPVPRGRRGAHDDDAARHWRGAPRVQPPAQARG